MSQGKGEAVLANVTASAHKAAAEGMAAALPLAPCCTLQLLIFGRTQKVTGVAILGAWALGSGTAQQWLAGRPRIVVAQKCFAAVVMMLLAMRLMFEERPSRL